MNLRHVCAGLLVLAGLTLTGCSACHKHCGGCPSPTVSSAPPCCNTPAPCCPNGAGPVQTFSGAPPVAGVYH
jgi:hypothetical protein